MSTTALPVPINADLHNLSHLPKIKILAQFNVRNLWVLLHANKGMIWG